MFTLRWLLVMLVLVSETAFAQLDSNTITIAASRNLYVPPDQVIFSLSVTTPITMGLDQVVAALASLGVTAADLQGASTPFGEGVVLPGGSLPGPTVTWTFTLAVPFAGLSSTLNSLATFQTNNSALQLNFSIVATQVSPQALAANRCPLDAEFSDALAQARKVAATAGLTVGAVLALSNDQSVSQSTGLALIPAYGFFVAGSIQAPSLPCSMVVKFGLSH
jgi:hypothetical protein